MNYFCKSRIIYLVGFVFTKRGTIKKIRTSYSIFCNSAIKMNRNSSAGYDTSAIKKTKTFSYSESVKR